MDDLPPLLQKLIDALTGIVGKATLALQSAPSTVAEWQALMELNLARYSMAAFMAGIGSPDLAPEQKAAVAKDVQAQLKFLDNFALEIQDVAEWQAGWNSRAAMYAESIKVPYWRGAVKMLPLPAMPAEGTQCHTRCGCSWEVVPVDEAKGDYNAYWRRSKNDSCQTCVQRAASWSPLEIRGGRLQ